MTPLERKLLLLVAKWLATILYPGYSDGRDAHVEMLDLIERIKEIDRGLSGEEERP